MPVPGGCTPWWWRMEWQDYRARGRARRASAGPWWGASSGWHLSPERRICDRTDCRCPSRPPGPFGRLRHRLGRRLAGPHPGLLLLVAVVALLLLLRG